MARLVKEKGSKNRPLNFNLNNFIEDAIGIIVTHCFRLVRQENNRLKF